MENASSIKTFAVLIILIMTRIAMAEGKPTIAILDFKSVGSEENLGEAIAEIMRTKLIGVGRYRVVERSQINKALSEQHMQQTGEVKSCGE